MAGFTTSALSDYTVEDKAELKTKSVYGAVSMPLFTIREGIKYSEKLPYITTDPQMQADTGCTTIVPSGDGGTFGQITLTVDGIKFEDGWCFKDLETKYTQKYLRKGAKHDEGSATELLNTIQDDYAARIAKKMEMAVWQSSKTQNTFNTNLKQFNGFIQTLTTAGGFVNQQTFAGTAYTSITTSNILTILDNQWLAVPADLRRSEDLTTAMGDDTFDKLIIALKNANQYHFTATTADAKKREIIYPGTTMRIVAVPGLNADNDSRLPAAFKNRILTFEKSNFVVGTDMISDMEDWETWYEKKDDKLYTRNRFKMTTGIHFTDRVVSFATV
jgi:hypothetical protein